jgi:hypothetical protein
MIDERLGEEDVPALPLNFHGWIFVLPEPAFHINGKLPGKRSIDVL